MILNNLKIKENITPELIASAIESVVDSCFINGVYNPYYQSFGERIAVVRFFLDGIELEENDSLYAISQLDEVKKLVDRFFGDARYSNPAQIMSIVKQNADQIIEYKKQRLIHGADALEYIATAIGDFHIFINDLDSAITNIARMDISSISNDDIEMVRGIISKLNASGVELNTETIAKVIKEAVDFNSDKASQEIIDAKNKQIEELQKRNAELEKEHNARNVLAFKKEVDG